MTTTTFFTEVILPTVHKIEVTPTEYARIVNVGMLVKATTLYDVYRHMIFESDARLPMKEFFRVCAQYLYYDKYVCTHGTEFYYYVQFNTAHEMTALMLPVITSRIAANKPDKLNDLLYIVKAFEKR
jgi:hypothetical protein